MMRFSLCVTVLLLAFVTSSLGQAKTSTAVKVLKCLQAGGLPVAQYEVYNASTDLNKRLGRPHQYVAKLNFHDRRLPFDSDYDTDAGGSIEVFTNMADAKARGKYIGAFSAMFPEYRYISRHAIMLR